MNDRAAKPTLGCPELKLIPVGGPPDRGGVALNKPVSLLKTPAAGPHATADRSPKQVAFLNVDGRIAVRDLTGRAGLQVNGKPVLHAELKDADRLQLGSVEFDVSAPGFTPANGTAPPLPRAEVSLRGGTAAAARPVPAPIAVVGRVDTADVRIPQTGEHDETGDVQAIILTIGGGFWLLDLHPADPSLVDGKPVSRAELAADCVLSFGGAEYDFRRVTVAAALPPVAPEAPGILTVSGHPPLAPAATVTSMAPPIQAPPSSHEARSPRVPPRVAATSPRPSAPAADFKAWGPLAFAVATAHEHGPDGAEVGADVRGANTDGDAPKRRWLILWILLAVAALAVATSYVAWRLLRP